MNVEYNDDYLMLSGIQHFRFCERQWALIHLEGQWNENRLTFEGGLIHERADDPFLVETFGEQFVSRSVPIVSHRLKLYGVADVVEFLKTSAGGVRIEGHEGLWLPYPVEYKHGQPKSDDCDLVQLCAQAMCLEEMLGIKVPEGAMYYHKIRRRLKVVFDSAVREATAEVAERMRLSSISGNTPRAQYMKKCEGCSLIDLCLPKISKVDNAVEKYMEGIFER